MKYYIEIENNLIISRGKIESNNTNDLEEPFVEVSEQFYNSFNVPASFELDDFGEFSNIISLPKLEHEPPQPTEIEILQNKVAEQDRIIEELMFVIIPEMIGGGM